jgi:hypothetical protein
MNFVRLIPAFLSLLLLSAHFFRAGQTVLMVIPLLLFIPLAFRQAWVPRLIQVVLLVGAIEWLRTIYSVAQYRIAHGDDWQRMAAILGAVALFTALSSLVFRSKGLRERYSENG